MHVAEQMGVVLQRTARSVNIKERLDFSCALFDGAAGLVANAPHIPVHLGSMGASVTAVLEAYGADAAPRRRVPAQLSLSRRHAPARFHGRHAGVRRDRAERLRFFVASALTTPTSAASRRARCRPAAGEIDEEGVLIAAGAHRPRRPVRARPGARLLTDGPAGRRAKPGAESRRPARAARGQRARRRARSSAPPRARLARRCSRVHGPRAGQRGAVHAPRDPQAARRTLRLRDGRRPADRRRGRDRPRRRLGAIDFTGTSAQAARTISTRRARSPSRRCSTCSARLSTSRSRSTPAACGRSRSASRRARCSIPSPPGAVVAGNVETSQCIVDALYGALGVQAAAQGTMNNLTFGNARYQYYETIAGGAGAGPGFDGASGVQTHMTNSRLTDPEVLEEPLPGADPRVLAAPRLGRRRRVRGGDGLVRDDRVPCADDGRHPVEPPSHRTVRTRRRRAGPKPGINRLLRADGRSQTLPGTAEIPWIRATACGSRRPAAAVTGGPAGNGLNPARPAPGNDRRVPGRASAGERCRPPHSPASPTVIRVPSSSNCERTSRTLPPSRDCVTMNDCSRPARADGVETRMLTRPAATSSGPFTRSSQTTCQPRDGPEPSAAAGSDCRNACTCRSTCRQTVASGRLEDGPASSAFDAVHHEEQPPLWPQQALLGTRGGAAGKRPQRQRAWTRRSQRLQRIDAMCGEQVPLGFGAGRRRAGARSKQDLLVRTRPPGRTSVHRSGRAPRRRRHSWRTSRCDPAAGRATRSAGST